MHYDIAVVGGGPGGYVAAIYAGKKNAKVALIEKAEIGGTCLNRGCIPTKALIHIADLYSSIKDMSKFGITVGEPELAWGKVQQRVNETVSKLRRGTTSLLRENKVEIYQGAAEFIDKNKIKIVGADKSEVITADKVIVATGSSPVIPNIPGHDLPGVITSDEALYLEALPKSIIIIGGGVIGVEMGYIYNTFGVEVTIVEMLPQILPGIDKEVASRLAERLKQQGIRISTNTKIQSIEKSGGALKICFENPDGTKGETETELVIMAVGRKANVKACDSLNLEKGKPGIKVNSRMRTNLNGVYAIGDVTGISMLAHVASHQGIVAARNALGMECEMDYKAVPKCIYAKPEVASVGLGEEEAREKYKDIKVGKFPFSASGKASISNENDGLVKIISDSKWNEVLGVHIVGPKASELIAEAVLALKLECTAEEISDTIHAHPTLSETIMEAAFDLLGEPIHKL